MKKKSTHIVVSVLLLALMLVSRVGIHVFHHHEPVAHSISLSGKKAGDGYTVFQAQENEADCALCKLDTFQEVSAVAVLAFVFFLVFVKPVYRFLLAASLQILFFAQNRGPPSQVCSA